MQLVSKKLDMLRTLILSQATCYMFAKLWFSTKNNLTAGV